MIQLRLKPLIVLLLISLSLSACSGGGGSSGSSSAETGARVLHGVIDYAPIEIFSSLNTDGAALQSVSFASNQQFFSLAEGAQVLSLRRVGSANADSIQLPITVTKGGRQTILFSGNTSSLGIKAAVFDAGPPPLGENQSAVRVMHATVGAGQISARFGATPLPAVDFGGASEYLLLPSGTTNLTSERVADGKLLVNRAYEFLPKKAYTILVSGEVDFFVVSSIYED